MKKIILIVILIGLISFIIYQVLKTEEPSFDLIEVTRGDIVQELWETGRVQRGERVNLSFKTAGEVEKIYVQANQIVEKGDPLAQLNTRDLNIQLEEAQLALELAQLNLEKLLAGVSPEEIQIAQTRVESSRILLEKAQKDLQNSYEAAVTVLNASFPELDEAAEFARDLVKDYVVVYDADARKIMIARDKISRIKDQAKDYWDIARKPGADHQDIGKTLSVMRSSLEEVFDGLEAIREIIDGSIIYKDKISAIDKDLFNVLKAGINSALADTISVQQTIASAKSGTDTAKTNFQEAQDSLALTRAEARQVDIDLYEIKIRQAQSKVMFYQNQLEEATLRSPLKAQVTAINKREGEGAMALEPIISLSPAVPFEISADIYEEDIVKVAVGAPVEISLPAFPGETFQGSVVFIDETESIIDGVVYYEIKIAFDENPPERLRATMTADIVIKTGSRENALVIPRETVPRAGDKAILEVLINDTIEEREVKIGLRGERTVEILSGLTEGEKVVLW